MARKLTLALGSKFITNPKADRELNYALSQSLFSRCQLTAMDSTGSYWPEEKAVEFNQCLETAFKRNAKVIISYAVLQNQRVTDKRVCARQAGLNAPELREGRICPGHGEHRRAVIRGIQGLLQGTGGPAVDTVHLSYFRYQNFFQCVCPRCRADFKKFRQGKGRTFIYQGPATLRRDDVVLDWVEWRQQVLTSGLREIKERCDCPLSLEIDYGFTKRYLAGPAIEEGLELSLILPWVDELYLHIEPYQPFNTIPELRTPEARRAYINNLRYIVSLCSEAGKKCHLFFWGLGDESEINQNLRPSLDLAREAEADGVVLYTKMPRSLVNCLQTIGE